MGPGSFKETPVPGQSHLDTHPDPRLDHHPALDNLLPRPEAAQYIRRSVRTLQEWTNRGWFTITRIGGRVYYDKETLAREFDALVASGKRGRP